jgi:Ion channel
MIKMWLGLAVLFLVLRDVFQTVLVARGKATNLRIATALVRHVLWPPYCWLAAKISAPVWKAEFLGIFAPLSFVMLLMVWISLLILGFGLILLAHAKELSPPIDSFFSALYVAGSYVLTLGCGDYIGKTTPVRLIMLAAALTGVIITASVVSLLFTLIGSFQRREVLVSITCNIAGSPPSGIAILETHASPNGRQSLGSFYKDWHGWCADVLESHRAYPLLMFFYPTDAFTSWLTSLGAVLDSIALFISTEVDADLFAAGLTYHLGTRIVNDLAENFNLDKSSTADISDEDFHTLYLRLKEANYAVTIETVAKQKFVMMRQNYAPAHQAICAYISVPQTPLLTDRKEFDSMVS